MQNLFNLENKQSLVSFLQSFLSVARVKKIKEVADKRSNHFTILLDNIYQGHNASAIVRTAEALGILDIYTIESKNKFKPNKDVSMGAHKWVNIHKFKSAQEAIDELKNKGYKIYACTSHKDAKFVNEINLEEKIAFAFGTELNGLSEEVLEKSDGFVKIPMYGFVESYNVSVAVAIALFCATEQLRNENPSLFYNLTKKEKLNLILRYMLSSFKKPDKYLRFLEQMRNLQDY